MKGLKLYSVISALLIVLGGVSAGAAPNIFGISGGLELPNDVVLNPGQVSLGYHGVFGGGVFEQDTDANFYTGTVGVLRDVEVGVGFADPDEGDSGVLFNLKYRPIAESAGRPAVTIGFVDAFSELDIDEDDPGAFVLLSKTLTGYVEDIANADTKPIRGHLGFGLGVYNGLLFGLDWIYSPKVQLGFEYLSEGIGDSDINAYLRWAPSRELRIDIGTIGFENFVAGISYTSARF